MTRIALVVAMAENGVIGQGGALPWHLPDDLRHFKSVTLGKPVLMGRRTFASIGRPLPGRRNLVLTRQVPPQSGAAIATLASDTRRLEPEYVDSIEQALRRIAAADELCVIGGAEVYALALPLAARVYLTLVHARPQGDTYFPPIEWGSDTIARSRWREVERSEHAADARHAYAMSFLRLELRSALGETPA